MWPEKLTNLSKGELMWERYIEEFKSGEAFLYIFGWMAAIALTLGVMYGIKKLNDHWEKKGKD